MYLNEAKGGKVTTDIEDRFRQHQQRKQGARMEKEKDKNIAQKDHSVNVATFDMEALPTTPCSASSWCQLLQTEACPYVLSAF